MSHATVKELAYRNQDRLEVTLVWDPRSNGVFVEVIDQLDASGFRLPIARPPGAGRVPPPLRVCAVAREPLQPRPADGFGGMTGMARLAPATFRRRNWARVVALQPLLNTTPQGKRDEPERQRLSIRGRRAKVAARSSSPAVRSQRSSLTRRRRASSRRSLAVPAPIAARAGKP
jgi:hypothetical protein